MSNLWPLHIGLVCDHYILMVDVLLRLGLLLHPDHHLHRLLRAAWLIDYLMATSARTEGFVLDLWNLPRFIIQVIPRYHIELILDISWHRWLKIRVMHIPLLWNYLSLIIVIIYFDGRRCYVPLLCHRILSLLELVIEQRWALVVQNNLLLLISNRGLVVYL